MHMEENYYIGIDVGTGSVRAALVKHNGEILNISTSSIRTWNPVKDFYEQSSNDIWNSCSQVVKNVSKSVDPGLIKGIGFDATCSLVCIGENDEPLTVSPTGNNEQNIILWMDHRSKFEAEFINNAKPEVLKYIGGKISPEMETPKLMWLKRHMPTTWARAKYFFDLVDFLTWKATGDDSRSLCPLVCKWTYIAGEKEKINGWDKNYFTLIDLADLLDKNSFKIGTKVRVPGEKLELGLSEKAAKDFNLLPGICVAAGLIDAHAGGLGLLTTSASGINPSLESKLEIDLTLHSAPLNMKDEGCYFDFYTSLWKSLICGTSTCHMSVSRTPKTVPGIWGPYFNAMLPDMYLNEGGQSATGKLIDFIIETHPAHSAIKTRLKDQNQIYDYLNKLLSDMASARNLPSVARLTSNLHIWPDFHGNRSPLADASLLGMFSGLSLTVDEEDLAVKYLSAIQSLAYGTKLIVETLRRHGYDQLSTLLMCGGLSKNKLFAQIHADVTGLPVIIPETKEPVLLGAAILGAVAAGEWTDIKEALENMSGEGVIYKPSQSDEKYNLRKYNVFLKMLEDQRSYEKLMEDED